MVENLGYNTHPKICGSSSVVEHDLAKVGVAGSTPVSRSILSNDCFESIVLGSKYLKVSCQVAL